MGLFSKDIKSMEDLFLHTLQDVYYAENQIVKSLPKMIEKSTNRELASGFGIIWRDRAASEQAGSGVQGARPNPKGTDCPAMDGLIKEADEVAGEVDDKKVLDAAIIGSAQAIEHYEISRYGTLIAWAEELGHDNVIRFSRRTEGGEGRGQEAEYPCRSETQSQGRRHARGCCPGHCQEADRKGDGGASKAAAKRK